MSEENKLNRSITLPYLIFYGLGTMVGGGFYALLGKVTGEAGLFTPIALLFSGLLALLTGLSYAELSSRFPVSAAEVRYISSGFDRPLLSRVIGALVILTGIVSAATLSVATIGFLKDYYQVPESLAIAVLVIGMGIIAAWGIGQSIALVTTITIIEVGALVYVAFVADADFSQLNHNWQQFVPTLDGDIWIGIFAGAFLAFYAFIGFEDMVNIAEEVEEPRRTLPIAIVVSVILTVLLYMLISFVALLTVSPEQLAQSNTPVAEIVKGHSWYSNTGLWIVSILTGLNGALVQIIMGSRVAYGMAKKGQAPRWFTSIHPRTQTPLHATIVITALILFLALFFPLTTLAKVTSGIILVIFAVVNLALWRIKRRDPDPGGKGIRIPGWLPLLGGLSCLFALGFQVWVLLVS
ncbi:MAG: APC family permease [Pseudomonadales bacterium]|nr:APC family permease [Pseudomonadales bacterium]